MMVKAVVFLWMFLAQALQVPAQQWDKADIERCSTASELGYLTPQEKDVIMYINMVRTQPQLFATTYLKTYLDTVPIEKTRYLSSLKRELETAKPQEVLKPQFDLYEVAKKHAVEMGAVGKVGHNSATGESYESRMRNVGVRYARVMENCQYGCADALSIVIDLLIDEDIPDVGHRKALLNTNVQYIGVSIQPHKVYRYNCVMELAFKFRQ